MQAHPPVGTEQTTGQRKMVGKNKKFSNESKAQQRLLRRAALPYFRLPLLQERLDGGIIAVIG
jgi:hypothetical protein